ncbi:MAG: DUF4160 domain-containing protein [Chitinophagaceae bacterium]|nr:DUF4160 domain-containing protein [Chitinophagaceae bacterium]
MPTILLLNGFRFFFYSNENNELVHIHVSKGDAVGKIWLVPEINICYLHGFNSREERDIMEIVADNCEQFKKKWDEYFGK